MGANPRLIQVNQTVKKPQNCNKYQQIPTKSEEICFLQRKPLVWQRECEEGNLGSGKYWSWRTTGTGHQSRSAGMQWLEGQGAGETQPGDTCSQLGAQPGHTTHLKALTHFAILYEKHVERD